MTYFFSCFFHFPLLTKVLGIAEMEKQIEVMRGTISALEQSDKEKPPKKVARQQPAPTASSSSKPAKVASSSGKSTTTKKSGKKSAGVPGGDDVLTSEQKKDLSKTIQTLDGQKLERVIQIIHEDVPEIRDVCFLVKAEKIRALKVRMALFEKGIATASNDDAGHGAGGENGEVRSSFLLLTSNISLCN